MTAGPVTAAARTLAGSYTRANLIALYAAVAAAASDTASDAQVLSLATLALAISNHKDMAQAA